MNEIMFVGSVVLLAVVVFWLASLIRRRNSGRDARHRVYHETHARSPRHRPAAHSVMHSHSTQSLLHSHDDIWRASRAKADESHWVPGVIVANRILSDSELTQKGVEQEHGYRVRTVDYKPADAQSETPRRAAGRVSQRKS